MAKKRTTHKLRGVCLKLAGKNKDYPYPLDRKQIIEVLNLWTRQDWTNTLPENFNSMSEHERLRVLAHAGIKHTPRYT